MADYDPDAELSGAYLETVAEGAGSISPVFEQTVREAVEEHAEPLDSNSWYRNADVEYAFEQVHEEVGEQMMQQGGIEAGKALDWPDEVGSVVAALDRWDDRRRDAYRNSDAEFPAGTITVEKEGERKARVGVTEGYNLPVAFAQGYSKGIAQDVEPNDEPITVTETEPGPGELAAWTLEW